MASITLPAPAKLNLFLEVTGKRADGYHELATLFAKISLADKLHIQAQPSDKENLTLDMYGPFAAQITGDANNLALKAAKAFEDVFNITLSAHIRLEKNIPTGAGLGGGSSDAGTVLLGLCRLFDKDPALLLERAAQLGADVPLFLYPDVFLKGEGIGEKLSPVNAGGVLPWAVLVYPDTPVPTKGVFARLQRPGKQEVLTSLSNLDKLIVAIQKGLPLLQWQHLLFNRLEEAVLPYVCSVRDVKENFSALGAHPLMSGSGSTVFALTPNRELADDLAGRIKQKGRKVFTVRFGGSRDENN